MSGRHHTHLATEARRHFTRPFGKPRGEPHLLLTIQAHALGADYSAHWVGARPALRVVYGGRSPEDIASTSGWSKGRGLGFDVPAGHHTQRRAALGIVFQQLLHIFGVFRMYIAFSLAHRSIRRRIRVFLFYFRTRRIVIYADLADVTVHSGRYHAPEVNTFQ